MRVFTSSAEAGYASPIADAWRKLSDEIRSCQKCRLHETRTQAVVYRGSLAPKILFVGEAPGVAEDREGIPFVGRSGQRLDAAVARIGLSAEEYGVLNLLKCRPPENHFDRAAARTCRPYLDRQVRLLSPRVLVTLGSPALHAFLPDAPPILRSAGRPRSTSSRPLFPLIHPAAAMRSRRMAERWAHDVDALGRWLARGPAQPV
ncbi:MAG: uracil-DNA glycosylase [Thermoplasmata archaeon]